LLYQPGAIPLERRFLANLLALRRSLRHAFDGKERGFAHLPRASIAI